MSGEVIFTPVISQAACGEGGKHRQVFITGRGRDSPILTIKAKPDIGARAELRETWTRRPRLLVRQSNNKKEENLTHLHSVRPKEAHDLGNISLTKAFYEKLLKEKCLSGAKQ